MNGTDEFESIAYQIISISTQIIALIKQKTDFAKSISYQIYYLFQCMGQIVKTVQNQAIDVEHLRIKLSQRQKRILFNSKMRPKAYLISEDICQFLHVSKQNLSRIHAQTKVQFQNVQQFFALVQREEEIQNQFVQILKDISIEKWFAQVDFFNNGYIDTTALYEYLLHYNYKEPVQQYNSLLIIRMIKKHTHSDKVFLEDFKEYLQQIIKLQKTHVFTSNLQQGNHSTLNHRVSSSAVQLRKSEKITLSHYKRLSHQIFPLESDSSMFSSPLLTGKYMNEGNSKVSQIKVAYRDTLELISSLKSEDEFQPNMTYEQRLLMIHARNQKYMQRVKMQMSDVIPMCRVQVQSHLQELVNSTHQKQLLDRLRLLGRIYNKKCEQIDTLITKCLDFNFFNAFQILDSNQKNQISFQKWLFFAKESRIVTTNKRLVLFYLRYSKHGAIRFSQFVAIFRLKACMKAFQQCQSRKPLFNDSLAEQTIQLFCKWFQKILKHAEEEHHLLEELKAKQQQLNKIYSNKRYVEQYINLLGQQYEWFLREYFEDQALRLWN